MGFHIFKTFPGYLWVSFDRHRIHIGVPWPRLCTSDKTLWDSMQAAITQFSLAWQETASLIFQ